MRAGGARPKRRLDVRRRAPAPGVPTRVARVRRGASRVRRGAARVRRGAATALGVACLALGAVPGMASAAAPDAAPAVPSGAPPTAVGHVLLTAAPEHGAADLRCAGADPVRVAGAVRLRASLSGVRATLSGEPTSFEGQPALLGATLAISAPGVSPAREAVRPVAGSTSVVPTSLTTTTPGTQPLCLARFVGDQLPTVLFAVTSGGAHCCLTVRAYSPGPHGWRLASEAMADSPVSLSLVGPDPVLIGENSAFAYRFADFAGSSMPLKLLAVVHGSFVDVTSAHLDLVSRQADALWASFLAERSDPLGALAAWAADQCELGRERTAFDRLDDLARSGSLVATPDAVGALEGATYVRALHAFLVEQRYCSS